MIDLPGSYSQLQPYPKIPGPAANRSGGRARFRALWFDSPTPPCKAQVMDHPDLIARAIALSEEGVRRAEGGPFGALVARAGLVIAEGWNRVVSSNDPTAHAEIVAIRGAAASLDSFSLDGCVLYSSCEPCPMCLAAASWARIEHVYYANTRQDAAAIGFDDQFFYDELMRPVAERSLPMTRIEVAHSRVAMQRWDESPAKTPY